MSFIKWESNDHPNANNSRYLGIAQIVLFIVGIFLPHWSHVTTNFSFVVAELLLGVGTYYTAIKVGFQNTFETNDDYKTVEQVASAIANIVVPLIFIVSFKDAIL